jgi:hypothetical protein
VEAFGERPEHRLIRGNQRISKRDMNAGNRHR